MRDDGGEIFEGMVGTEQALLLSFAEAGHLTGAGDLDIYGIVKALVENGFDGYVRPDHGRNIWGEDGKPGYGLYDRALGAAYLNEFFEAIGRKIDDSN